MFLLLLLFGTPCFSQSYCSCGPTTSVDTNLGGTTLAGETLTIVDTTDCPGFVGPRDLTYLQADLAPGVTYALVFNVTTCGNVFPSLAGAWIDYNQNLLFDSFESLAPFTAAKNTVTFSFTIPSEALTGTTRLRVQVQETQATTLNPCASFPYGGTKDFSVIIGQRYCDSGPTTSLDANLGLVQLFGDRGGIDLKLTCPGQIGPQLSNQSTSLVRGNKYTLTINVTSCSNASFGTLSGFWIDLDHNGQYSDKDLIASTQEKGIVDLTFTLPTGGYLGNTSLRVQVQETNGISLNPCAMFPYGATQDFWINLTDSSSTYCISGPMALQDTALGPVTLNGISKNINNQDGCPGVLGPQDLTSQSADLLIGGAYTINYTVLNCTANQFPVVSTAWIDFDQNLLFETWEQISTFSTSFGARSVLFKVPVSTPSQAVKIGKTRLRVQVQEKAGPPIIACEQFAYGGTKDFTILISG